MTDIQHFICNLSMQCPIFTARCSYASAVVGVVILSVCPSVRPPVTRVLCDTPFTRYSRLSNRLYNRFYNRLCRVNKHPTGCKSGCWMFVKTIQPVVKPVLNEQPERTATVRSTGCQTGLYNRLNVCIHDTTGCQAF